MFDIEQAEATITRVALKHYVTVDRVRGYERNKHIQSVRREVANELYKQGYTIANIGRVMHRDPATILYMLKRIGIRRDEYELRRLMLALSAENERMNKALMLCAKHVDWMPHPHCVEVEAAIRAALGETE